MINATPAGFRSGSANSGELPLARINADVTESNRLKLRQLMLNNGVSLSDIRSYMFDMSEREVASEIIRIENRAQFISIQHAKGKTDTEISNYLTAYTDAEIMSYVLQHQINEKEASHDIQS